jgi:hypothetical protein
LVEFPSDADSLILSEEVDIILTPCEWTNVLYETISPKLAGRCISWPAGVDPFYWKPLSNIASKIILIYEKQRKGPVGPVDPYIKWLRERGYEVELINCGDYSASQFLDCLQRASMMVGFVVDESQGLAWAEAWSADVPTFVWRNTRNTIRGVTFDCSTAPYLDNQNGIFFDDYNHFKKLFVKWESGDYDFHPRSWVINNMTDQVCAAKLCQLAGID